MSAHRSHATLVRLAAVAAAVSLFGAACGSGESDGASGAEESAASGDAVESSSDSADGADGEATDGGAQGDVAASVPWSAPDGMTVAAIAASPSGDQVALSFSAPPGLEAAASEVVVYDVASGAEVWRSVVEDGGLFGLSTLLFVDAGVVGFKTGYEGSSLVAFDTAGVVSEIETDAAGDCVQYLNGDVDAGANVAYTVNPGGFCRLDLVTGATVNVRADDLISAQAGLMESIRFDGDGALVASFTDSDFTAYTYVLDPQTLAVLDDSSTRTEPASRTEALESMLDGSVNLSSESRLAESADGSVVAVLQPDRVDVVNL